MKTADNDTFEWPVRVYYEDTDAQGVVYYANYFRFMERARTEWLRTLGVDMAALMEQQRRIFVVAEVNVRFISPARLNDNLVITARLHRLSRVSFDIEQNVFRDTPDGQLLVQGDVKAAYLDCDTMRPRRIPTSIFGKNKL